ncbi:MAG: SRPBCC family protein [Planctomycetes bacterium]|nr:SRPBCC family protein [Planctomycetota bacterium]
MKKVLMVVGLVTLVFLVLFVVIGFFLPTRVSVARTVTIHADKPAVHAWCSDLKKWPEWTPWAEADKTVVTTLGPITSGVGASQSWTGDSGNGELTLTQSDPNTGIAYDMNFINGEHKTPMKSAMTYRTSGDATEVTWTLDGDMDTPVLGGYVVLMMGGAIDAMFDQGLAKLKTKVEGK